jgi:tRNA A-37 threonylcarbamoyl transferase component Bud32
MSVAELEPGFIGDRYRLERLIARGGMAEVWLGHDTFLDRQVAIKVLKRHIARDETAIERFRREALACAGLNHPNIVAVYDSFAHDGNPVVVMQYVQGRSLRDLLDKKKRLTPSLTIMMGASIAAALDATHRHGYVHRDVKPGNILVRPDGHFLLADFGIAKTMNTPEGEDLTNDNIMMGTAKYLSPEIVRGKQLDGRADLYSLGLVLYECLSGKVPFLCDNDADTALARLQREPTDLGHLRPTLSPRLVRTVHKLLARNPDHRYQSGDDTRTALLAALNDERDDLTTDTPPSGHRIELERTVRPSRTTGAAPRVVNRQRRGGAALGGYLRTTTARLLLATLILTGLVIAAVVRTNDPDNVVVPDVSAVATADPIPAGPATIVAVNSYDPNGDDGVENEEIIGALIDKNPQSAWATSCYSDKFFGAKGRVGVLVTLSGAGTGLLRVNFANGPWGAEIYGVSGPPPSGFEGWGAPLGKDYRTRGEVVKFPVSTPVTHLLVVLTEIGRSDSCSATNPFQGRLNELAFVPA